MGSPDAYETVTMAYDANGNMTRRVDALGNAVIRTYDPTTNRLLTETTSRLGIPAMVNRGGMTFSGNDIIKSGGADGSWDASVRSGDGLVGGATVVFQPRQTNKALMVGLTTDPGASHSYSSIDYALYCTTSGTLYAYENGVGVPLGATYAVGDSLRVTYDGTNVTYLNGSTVLRTVAASIGTALYVDTSFRDLGATIGDLDFRAPDNSVIVALLAESNVTVSPGGTITKTAGAVTAWDSSVRSLKGYTGAARVSFVPAQTDKSVAVGLSRNASVNGNYSSIDYAILCTGSGTLRCSESGTLIDLGVTYTTSDTLRVIYDGTKVSYLKISGGVTTVLREVTVSVSEALYLDTSFSGLGGAIQSVKFGRTTWGSVTALALESGVVVAGDTLEKIEGTDAAWDAATRSAVGYIGQANLSFGAAQTDKYFMVGLNTDPAGSYSWSNLDWAFYCKAGGVLEVRESGSGNVLSAPATYAVGDRLQITYDGTYVRYLKNGVELRKVAAAISQPLYVDSAFYNIGAKVVDLRFGDQAQSELTTRYVYSSAKPNQLRYLISAEGRVTQYLYSSYGERTYQITYPGNVYALAGMAATEVPTETQMNDWVTAIGDLSTSARTGYVYDARGMLSMLKEYGGSNPDGSGKWQRQTQFVYDQAGRLLQTIRAGGSAGDEIGSPTTTWTYDGLGRVLTQTDAHGAVTTSVYSDSAQKITSTYQSGAVATSVFDKAGRLVSLARSGNGSTQYAYDSAGRLVMTTDPKGARSFLLYDEAGRQVGAVDADGTLTETTYDKAGRVTRVHAYATAVDLALLLDDLTGVALSPALADIRPATLSADVQHWNVYDDAGRLIYEIADNGALTQHDYDDSGREIRKVRYGTLISAASSPTLLTVGEQMKGLALLLGAASDRAERYFYDADGRRVGTLDAEGYLTRSTYDGAGRLVQTRRYAQQVDPSLRAGGGDLDALLPGADDADQVDTYFYDGRGDRIGQVDAGGYLTRYTYDSRGLLRTQTRYASALATPPAWSASFDALILSIRPGGADALQPEDRRETWYYTLDGQVLQSVNHEGTITDNTYDAAGRLIQTTIGVGLATARTSQWTYDDWGRQRTEVAAGGGTTTSTVDGADRLIAQVDANDNKSFLYYDVDGRLRFAVNARGEVTETQYNTLGQRTASVQYANRISTSGLTGGLVSTALTGRIVADALADSTTSFAYNSAGQLSSVTDAEGAVTSLYYNAFGEVARQLSPWQSGSSLNASKREDLFVFDRRGALVQSVRDTAGVAAVVATEYDAFGRVVQTTDADGMVRSTSYDRLGRVLQTVDPLGGAQVSTYDAFGQVLSTRDALGKTTTYAYDRAQRTVTVTTPEGVVLVTTRTAFGQTYSLIDGNGHTTTYDYDVDGNLTQTEVGSTVVDARNYDVGGRLVTSTDAAGRLTTYTYDAANRLLKRTVDPTDADAAVELNLVTSWQYDAKGQVITMTDPRSVVTTYAFDRAGHRTRQVVDPTGLALTTTWTVDAEGRTVTQVDPNGVTTSYTYDRLGRQVQERLDPTGLNLTRSYTYDANGNVTSATDARGKVTRYRYDDAGRQIYVADAAGSVTRNDYDAKGRLVKQTRFLDTVSATEEPSAVAVGADQVTRYAYDDDDRLEFTVDALGGVTKNEFDANGNVVRTTRFASAISANQSPSTVVANAALDHVTRIEYDAFNRETYRADPMGAVSRSVYDAVGNVVSRTRFANTVLAGAAPSGVNPSTGDRVDRFMYDAANRLIWSSDALGAVTGTVYDKNGNVTQVTRYATTASGGSPDTVVADSAKDRSFNYFYDLANRETWRVDGMGFVTRTDHDANGNIVATRRYANLPDSRSTPGHVVADNTNDRIETFQFDESNRLASHTDPLGLSESFTYDGAGNKLTYTNKNGDVWHYEYDAVGRLTTETSPVVALTVTSVNGSGDIVAGVSVNAGVVTQMTYDTFGNLVSRTEGFGRTEARTTTYGYDKLGRQTSVTYPTVMKFAESSAATKANSLLGIAARASESSATPTTSTYYDVFGNAVASVDRAGSTNYKAYDLAGRVAYEVDALGYVTSYSRNAFGESTAVLRYAQATALNGTAAGNAASAVTTATVSAAVNATGVSHAQDRKITYVYDAAGRVTTQTEPVVYTYDTGSNSYDSAGAKTTQKFYNAFGEVTRVRALRNRVANTWVDTYHYFDQGGREVASADALGYLTVRAFDCVGNLTSSTEFATAMSAGTWNASGYAAPTPNVDDRKTTFAYDKANRKTSETRYSVEYSSSANGYSGRTNLTTSYRYDAVGNLTRTTDALGKITYSYYDALGRVTAVAAPTRSSTTTGSALTPVTEFARDAYGNVVVKIDRYNTGSAVSEAGYGTIAPSASDRITEYVYDANGNVLQEEDALGFDHYNAYTVDGRVAKSWQTVTDNDGVASTLYTRYAYDKLGRVTNTYTPSPTGANWIDTGLRYNAFGEVVQKGINGGWQESFEYDNAGRLWRTTSGAEFGKVFLYDLLGNVTAEITNAGSGRSGAVDVRSATGVADAAGMTSVRRTNTQYDALGRVVATLSPERLIKEGGVTVRRAIANVSGISSSSGEGGASSVNLSWTTLAYLGSGEVRVDLGYVTQWGITGYGEDGLPIYGTAHANRSESQIFRGDLANAGVTLSWVDDGATWQGGISSVSSLVVYKKNVNGDWVKIIDRNPGAGRAFGTYGEFVEAGSPIDPSTAMSFKYKLSTASSWTTVSMSALGDSHWWDASALSSGTYNYEVYLTAQDGVPTLGDSGSFTMGVTLDNDDTANAAWQRPVEYLAVDRWGNVVERSDPRNATWKTVYRYNANNQVVEERQPNPANGDQDAGSPVRYVFYDKMGRQIATKDARGFVNGTLYDEAGNLVTESHADGGKLTHLYDVFGQRVRTVDAIGNASGASAKTITNHTTTFDYDKLGRLKTVTHGTTSGGSVSVWGVNSGLTATTGGGYSNLTETYTYDEAGRKLMQKNGAAEATKYGYDLAGHVILTTQPLGGATSAVYNVYGHKESETDANGKTSSWQVNYFGRTTSHVDIGGATTTYLHDTAGLLTSQSSTRGQNLGYTYDAAGQLVQVADVALGQVSTYAYDLAGHRLREKSVLGTEVTQDNHLAYDILGRLRDSADNRAHLSFEYDAQGNRTRVKTHVRVDAVGDDDVETLFDEDRYFSYDSMNRQLLVDGYSDGSIGTRGHRLTYDLNGNRATDTFWGNHVNTSEVIFYDEWGAPMYSGGLTYSTYQGSVTEAYTYDALDRLDLTVRDGVRVDVRLYDGASRVVQSGPASLPTGYAAALNSGVAAEDAIGLELRRFRYDANGRLGFQRTYKSDGTSLKNDIDYEGLGRNGATLGYDAAGNVVGYEFKNYEGTDYTNTTSVTLGRFEGYVETQRVTVSTNSGTGTTNSSYDKNGYLTAIDDLSNNTFDRTIANDAAGRALRVVQNGNTLYTHIVNGEILGRHGVGPNEIDPRTKGGSVRFAQIDDFEFGYRSITGSYPSASVGQYTVRQGDTLQGIAQAAYGDSRQWWRIAQANGVSGDRDLRVGQSLTLPTQVAGASNSDTTFKPYNPSEVVGDTSPNLPQPSHGGGCGGLGQVIMIVVAVAVTVYTAGAFMAQAGATFGQIMTAGASALAPGGGLTLAQGAMAAAAGSIASQAVGVAIGAQEGFSWKSVALSAIAGGMSAGVGKGLELGNQVANAAMRAAMTNAMSQGIGVVTGLQDHFSWAGVAASAIGGRARRGGRRRGQGRSARIDGQVCGESGH